MEDYYVYRHIDPNSGEVVYVGKGRADRAWSVRSLSSRQADHIEWFNNQNPFECVQCVARNLSSKKALEIEKLEIFKLNPKFNRRKDGSDYKSHNQKLDEDDAFVLKYMFIPSNMRHKEIAKLFGISVGSVSQIKNGSTWRHV